MADVVGLNGEVGHRGLTEPTSFRIYKFKIKSVTFFGFFVRVYDSSLDDLQDVVQFADFAVGNVVAGSENKLRLFSNNRIMILYMYMREMQSSM